MKRGKDHHPHFAGHRHGGIAVGERAKRSGPAPGQTEFSADQEQAMRTGGPGGATGGAPPSMGGAPPSTAGAPSPVAGTPVPADLDQDGGI